MLDMQVREVNDALTWVLDNAQAYGGDTERVKLFAHSAGAQLCMMALLHRARAGEAAAPATKHLPVACQATEQSGRQHAPSTNSAGPLHDASELATSEGGGDGGNVQDCIDGRRADDGALCTSDARMPAAAVFAAGVYDMQVR